MDVSKLGGLAGARAAVLAVYRGTASPEIHKRVNRLNPELRHALLKDLPLTMLPPTRKAEPGGGIYGDVQSFEMPSDKSPQRKRVQRVIVKGPKGGRQVRTDIVRPPTHGGTIHRARPGAEPKIVYDDNDALAVHRAANTAKSQKAARKAARAAKKEIKRFGHAPPKENPASRMLTSRYNPTPIVRRVIKHQDIVRNYKFNKKTKTWEPE